MEFFYTGERLHPKQDDLNAISYTKQYQFISKMLKGKSVLDNACGNGIGAMFYHKFGAKKIVGIDISKEAVDEANGLKIPNSQFLVMDGVDLKLEDSSFDAVVSVATLEHIKDYNKYVKECKRVLKKGGLLFVETPNSLHYKDMKSTHDFHEKEFTHKELKTLLSKHFKVEKFYGVSFSKRGAEFIENVKKKRKNPVFEFLFSYIYIPLNIYIPASVKKMLRKSISKSSFSDSDVIISTKDVDKAYEFIVICRK